MIAKNSNISLASIFFSFLFFLHHRNIHHYLRDQPNSFVIKPRNHDPETFSNEKRDRKNNKQSLCQKDLSSGCCFLLSAERKGFVARISKQYTVYTSLFVFVRERLVLSFKLFDTVPWIIAMEIASITGSLSLSLS